MSELTDNHDSVVPTAEARASHLKKDSVQEHSFDGNRPGQKSTVREWAGSLAFTIIFVLIFTNFIAQATQVPTESMKPTIMVGDHFFLDKLAFPANYPRIIQPYLPKRALERGDVIAFRAPNEGNIPFVKRVIGLPGDVIDIRNKIVFVNGEVLEEPYKIHVDKTIYSNQPWTPNDLRIRDNYGPATLPKDSYFVMGDNRDNSSDGRYWGFINRESVIGKPLFIYWSYDGEAYIPGRRSIVEKIKTYALVARNFFSETRWFRMGLMIR